MVEAKTLLDAMESDPVYLSMREVYTTLTAKINDARLSNKITLFVKENEDEDHDERLERLLNEHLQQALNTKFQNELYVRLMVHWSDQVGTAFEITVDLTVKQKIVNLFLDS